jgi:hypothetical protein
MSYCVTQLPTFDMKVALLHVLGKELTEKFAAQTVIPACAWPSVSAITTDRSIYRPKDSSQHICRNVFFNNLSNTISSVDFLSFI